MIYRNLPKKFKPRFSVVSCYLEYRGQIVLLRRRENKSEGNKWGTPAGKIDGAETPLAAIIREVREETGQILAPAMFNYLDKVYVKYPDYHFIYHMFRAKLDSQPEIKLSPSEHLAYKWFTPQAAISASDLVRDLDRCLKMSYKI